MSARFAAFLCASALAVPRIVEAADEPIDEPTSCEVASPLEPQRLLRRLSLDLRGEVPSYDDITSNEAMNDSDTTIDRFLA